MRQRRRAGRGECRRRAQPHELGGRVAVVGAPESSRSRTLRRPWTADRPRRRRGHPERPGCRRTSSARSASASSTEAAVPAQAATNAYAAALRLIKGWRMTNGTTASRSRCSYSVSTPWTSCFGVRMPRRRAVDSIRCGRSGSGNRLTIRATTSSIPSTTSTSYAHPDFDTATRKTRTSGLRPPDPANGPRLGA